MKKSTSSRKKHFPSAQQVDHAKNVYQILAQTYPHAKCGLDFHNPYELLVATILSAQCTDQRVNLVLPSLFARCPDLAALAATPLPTIQKLIRSVGLYQNKAKNLKALAQTLAKNDFIIPQTMAELVKLPGVGRKTANVILSNAWNKAEGIAVDTHVQRLAQILDLSSHADPLKIEQDLMQLYPAAQWGMLSHLIITHGRQCCQARTQNCAQCPLAPLKSKGCLAQQKIKNKK
jgi:endonuclease-3